MDKNPTWSSELQKERSVCVPLLRGTIPVMFFTLTASCIRGIKDLNQ
jgi:hypothetical protein